MATDLTRRRLIAIAAAAVATPSAARSEEAPITLGWRDLVPEDQAGGTLYSTLSDLGLLQLGEKMSPWAIQPPAAMVRDYDDKLVRIPGFIIPLGFIGTGVVEGLLVPYVGACIHVPPPPANQIVYIQLKEAKDEAALWDPVWATGRFTTQAIETQLAEVGYFMDQATLEPYTG